MRLHKFPHFWCNVATPHCVASPRPQLLDGAATLRVQYCPVASWSLHLSCLGHALTPQEAYWLFRFRGHLRSLNANRSHCFTGCLMCFTCFRPLMCSLCFRMYMTVVAKIPGSFYFLWCVSWEGSPFSRICRRVVGLLVLARLDRKKTKTLDREPKERILGFLYQLLLL